MAIWGVVEIFKDAQLLNRVRNELEKVNFRGIEEESNVEILLKIPLLQSIYHELLRLRVEVQTLFSSDKEDIQLGEWRLPKGSIVVVPAGDAHQDPDVWNTKGGRYPIDEFWADRFLSYPGDAQSGPRKPFYVRPAAAQTSFDHREEGHPKFVLPSLTDSWMPFGIGERTCPGRGFAKKEIIWFCAFIVDSYDIELVAGDQDYGTTTAFYGIGTQRPRSKMPFRIRKKPEDKRTRRAP